MIIISCDLAENDSTNNATAKEIEVIELVEIYLNNFLDEPRGFCLDIKGYKSSASVERGLQAHTCYSYQGEIAVDQGFDFARLANQEFYLPNFDICMQAEKDQETAELVLRPCDKSALQQFVLGDDGKIYLQTDQNLCVTVSRDNSREGGGGSPVHLIRNISMQKCNDDLSSYQIWTARSN